MIAQRGLGAPTSAVFALGEVDEAKWIPGERIFSTVCRPEGDDHVGGSFDAVCSAMGRLQLTSRPCGQQNAG